MWPVGNKRALGDAQRLFRWGMDGPGPRQEKRSTCELPGEARLARRAVRRFEFPHSWRDELNADLDFLAAREAISRSANGKPPKLRTFDASY